MAEVIFLTGVADVAEFTVRLLRKKYREGARVAVYAPPPLLQRVDHALWVAEQLDFTPHIWLKSGSPTAAQLARTPLWLLAQPQPGLQCDSGVNLGCEGLDLAAIHERVAEVISTDAAEAAAGRARWKGYEAQGHTLRHHPHR